MENTFVVHDLDPFLIQFSQGIGIRWYGLAYVLGFVIGILLLRLYHRKGLSPLDADSRWTLLMAIAVGTVLGGRLGYVLLYRPEIFLENPLGLIAVWSGGMASHGGMVGIAAGIAWFVWFYNRRMAGQVQTRGTDEPPPRLSWWRISDLCVTLAPPGILLGRIANYINGELWGRVSTVPWAHIFPMAQEPPHFDPNGPIVFVEGIGLANPRHPSQLYGAALEGLVLGIYLHWRLWRGGITARYGKNPRTGHPGQLTGEFLIAYAILRIIGEVFREPDASLIMGVSRGIFYSLFMVVAGIGVIWWARRKPSSKSN